MSAPSRGASAVRAPAEAPAPSLRRPRRRESWTCSSLHRLAGRWPAGDARRGSGQRHGLGGCLPGLSSGQTGQQAPLSLTGAGHAAGGQASTKQVICPSWRGDGARTLSPWAPGWLPPHRPLPLDCAWSSLLGWPPRQGVTDSYSLVASRALPTALPYRVSLLYPGPEVASADTDRKPE